MNYDPPSGTGDLPPKTQLGLYRIEERLGAGGMGIVYRATDTKLERSVALKLIRPELLQDDGLSRFAREARLLAALTHPHVAAIYGMEESGGTPFLVLEYVSGPTLAERLRRGPLPLREAIGLARQLCEALEAAHAKGIIHRDLKPANIKVSGSGEVKVLDFGLAKSVRPHHVAAAGDITETMTSTLSGERAIIGTAAYMSPEQAVGKEVDSRTDIWAFGCVLYEALCGRHAFAGETVAEILAAVIEREPDWSRLPTETPEPVESLLRRCLRKDPQRRLRDIGDARIELEDWLAAPASAPATPSGLTRRTAISGLAGAAVGAVTTGIFAISRYRGAIPRSLTRFSIALPEREFLAMGWASRLAIAPDGKRLCFLTGNPGASRLYLHSLSELEPKLVKDITSGYSFFSPDSRWVAYFTPNPPSMRKLALASYDLPPARRNGKFGSHMGR
jgi:serine/threonine protein kinase